ncbi:hypothetical protein ND2E_2315 [Colwellia psychrerythraea]|uniref:O-antigen polymerase n=1 Tax=Colwellia psychrerythraea TaxID=28229 RepID=A0A099KSU6_COLPS|nr:hypothetical protein ND2E_2315 [Colwellia psychrerythraea]
MFIKNFFSYTAIFMFVLFVVVNSLALGQVGVGYPFLGVILLLSTYLFIATCPKVIIKIRKKNVASLIFLIVFFLYIFLSVIINTWDLSKLKALTIGTSGGILFSFLFGWIFSLCIDVIRNTSLSNRLRTSLHYIFLFFTLFACVFVVSNLLSSSSDRQLLVLDSAGAYQRPADLMIMSLMLIAAVSLVANEKNKTITFISINALCVSIVAMTLSLVSQLLGSNMGLVGCLAILIIYLFCVFFKETQKVINGVDFYLSKVLLNRKGNFWLAAIKLVLSLFLVFSLLVTLFDIPFDMLRITGYGSGEASSVNSRFAIIKKNFIDQLAYNPIFGHSEVETLLNTKGEYIHSFVLSLATHTGLIGLILFGLMMFFVYRERLRGTNLAGGQTFSLFRISIILFILLLGSFFTFYAWMPFWFALGLFGFSRHT